MVDDPIPGPSPESPYGIDGDLGSKHEKNVEPRPFKSTFQVDRKVGIANQNHEPEPRNQNREVEPKTKSVNRNHVGTTTLGPTTNDSHGSGAGGPTAVTCGLDNILTVQIRNKLKIR